MKLLYVTSQSGRRINGFMRSAIIAARQLNIDFTIVSNMDHADKQLYEEDCRTYGIKAEHIDCDRNPLAKKNYTLAKKQLLDLMKREKYDVVHCNTPIGGVLGRICANKAILLLGFLLHFAPDSWENAVCRGVIRLPFVGKAVLMVALIYLVIQMKSSEIQPFIYFQF